MPKSSVAKGFKTLPKQLKTIVNCPIHICSGGHVSVYQIHAYYYDSKKMNLADSFSSYLGVNIWDILQRKSLRGLKEENIVTTFSVDQWLHLARCTWARNWLKTPRLVSREFSEFIVLFIKVHGKILITFIISLFLLLSPFVNHQLLKKKKTQCILEIRQAHVLWLLLKMW